MLNIQKLKCFFNFYYKMGLKTQLNYNKMRDIYLLPQDILTKIFGYDDTYKVIFKNEVTKELWIKAWLYWYSKNLIPVTYFDNISRSSQMHKDLSIVPFAMDGIIKSNMIYDINKNVPLFYFDNVERISVNYVDNECYIVDIKMKPRKNNE